MKKFAFVLMTMVCCIALFNKANAQTRKQVGEDLYLVSSGNTFVLEDEKNQRTISMEITQAGIDERTHKKVYQVTCGKWTKRVVKDGLDLAIKGGLGAAVAGAGIPGVAVSAVAKIAKYIYDDVCDYYGTKYGDD